MGASMRTFSSGCEGRVSEKQRSQERVRVRTLAAFEVGHGLLEMARKEGVTSSSCVVVVPHESARARLVSSVIAQRP